MIHRPVALSLTVLTISCSLLSLLLSPSALVFSPMDTFISLFQPYRILTAPLVNSLLLLPFYTPLLYSSLSFIESFWGSKLLLSFLTASYLPACLITVFLSVLLFAFSGLSLSFLTPNLHGSLPLLSMLSIACAYVRPELSPTLSLPNKSFKIPYLKLQYLPFIFIILSLINFIFLGQSLIFGFWVFSSLICSYCYIRYLMNNPLLSSRGDRGPQFAFALFFPSHLRPIIRIISTQCSKLLRLPLTSSDSGSDSASDRFGLATPIDRGITADRRRQKALAMVEMELKRVSDRV
ncbi:hypothetical protein P9112_009490 [Eukaryota sp. TZLM1-RC]